MADATDPRIPPVRRAEADAYQQALFEVLGSGEPLHLFGTLAHHSKLLKDWLPLGGRLLYGGLLDDRTRELAILRTSARCGSAYEWGQHVAIARGIGLSDPEILAVAEDTPGEPLSTDDRTLLGAVDEIVDGHTLGDQSFMDLTHRFDPPRVIEFVMLIGQYVMLAGLLNALAVQTEGPLPPIGSVTVPVESLEGSTDPTRSAT